ncbi:metallophosphoesterase [Candidatus Epulonipiscium viviparus]|uniref:metallophosphoesterase n=1 Tax=Candidatus Epulonipiscium viviparus TaxID=420336 RepID=UPI0004975248|nr:metallophosphoesterase [Candidatus Epulopiscium viviparus]
MKKIYLIGGLILGYALAEPYIQRIKKYKIVSNQIPPNFHNYKIAFLADIHYGRTINAKSLTKIVNRVNNWNPDLIILGGDYVMMREHIYPCFKILSTLKSKQGIYAVIGNHDVMESLHDTRNAMHKYNIKSINNAAYWIEKGDQRIKLGGVGDLRTQRQLIEPTVSDTTINDYIILVTHNPRYIYQLKEEYDISLVLAGHTHGGQISALKYLGKIVPPVIDQAAAFTYLSGKTNKNAQDVIVSNGIGTAKFPIRILTWPETIFITLKSENINQNGNT